MHRRDVGVALEDIPGSDAVLTSSLDGWVPGTLLGGMGRSMILQVSNKSREKVLGSVNAHPFGYLPQDLGLLGQDVI